MSLAGSKFTFDLLGHCRRSFSLPHRNYGASIKLVTCGLLLLTISACSTVAVNKQTAAETLVAQRGNIVTDDKLSTATSSALLSAGLNEEACILSFEQCLTQLSDSLFDEHYRQALAIFAELHYTKAIRLKNSEACGQALERAPLDPYYANAPLPNDEANRRTRLTKSCISQYYAELFEAVKYSYAYLFYDVLEHDFEAADNAPPPKSRRLPSEMDIQTQDIYNAASNDIITQLYESSKANKPIYNSVMTIEHLPVPTGLAKQNQSDNQRIDSEAEQVKVMRLALGDYNLGVYLPNEDNYLIKTRSKSLALTDLISTYELRLSGLNSISKRDGFGISFVASLDDRYTTSIRQLLNKALPTTLSEPLGAQATVDDSEPSSRIYPTGHLLLTGLIQPKGDSILEVLSDNQLDIHLYNPYRTEAVSLLGDEYPLAANFSASYGLWLAENQLSGVGYLNLLTPQSSPSLPRLFMLEPYDPNKRVIIMLHGLASSPATWVNLTNDIFNDETLRDHYQVWQVFYPTNLPILENRYQIRRLLETAYEQTDPTASHASSHNSVIISHSMGAVIARMLVSDTDLSTRLDGLNMTSSPDGGAIIESAGIKKDRQLSAMLKSTYGTKALIQRFDLEPLDQVDTVVFLSAPFRGTDYAERWFTRALRRIVHLPIGLVQTVTSNLTTIATQGELAQNPLGALYLQNGASQLSDKSSFVKLTKDIHIVPKVTYHSIIANADSDIAVGLAQLESNMVKFDLSQVRENQLNSNANNLNTDKFTLPASDEITVQDNAQLATDVDSKSAGSVPAIGDSAGSDNDDDSAPKLTTQSPYIASVTVNGDLGEALTDKLSDGIVPYKSSHLEGAASETIISGGHSIQENPQTILTLRRILHQQLKKK